MSSKKIQNNCVWQCDARWTGIVANLTFALLTACYPTQLSVHAYIHWLWKCFSFFFKSKLYLDRSQLNKHGDVLRYVCALQHLDPACDETEIFISRCENYFRIEVRVLSSHSLLKSVNFVELVRLGWLCCPGAKDLWQKFEQDWTFASIALIVFSSFLFFLKKKW